MDESISAFINSVNIATCRISNTPHLIFLCGGATDKSKAGLILSARDYFHRYVQSDAPELAKRVRLAEEINDWFDQDKFADLLELEVYLADVADLTILFVESPGSIAELGAFAASDWLRPKTLAILNSTHPSARTFIADGPVRCIRRHDENLIRYYEWNSADLTHPSNLEVFQDMSRELAQYVIERGAATPKERLLDGSHGHKMFLIADLVDLIGITTSTEIIDCLSLWKYEVDKKTLNKYLSLLEHLRILKRKLYSTQTYFVSTATSAFVRYDFVAATKVRDRERIKAAIRTGLSERDPRRMKIYERELLGRVRPRRRHV